MRLFGRRGQQSTEIEHAEEPTDDAAEQAADADRPGQGPWDVADEPELGRRVDLGALRIPARAGMKIRMEMDKSSKRIVAVNVGLEGSAVQVQAFAAPRSSGIWEDLRTELAASIDKQGGSAQEQDGPFGVELLARLPVRTKDGRSGHRPARFIGVDGSRWFLRGVVTGRAALDADAAAEIEEVLGDVVVVRGTEPRAPRDLLTLHMPGKPGEEVEQPAETRPTIDLGSKRGPEITEVR